MPDASFTPIAEYGLVGNLQTCALVSTDGSIDWFPFPYIESPSVFAAILDPDRGGRFRLRPTVPAESAQAYVDGTNVLETTYRTETGTATVTDFMPPAGGTPFAEKVLYRKATCSEGTVSLEADLEPRFDYGRAETTLDATDEGVRAEGDDERVTLESPTPLAVEEGHATGEVALDAGDTEWFVLRCTGAETASADPEAALEATIEYWRDWTNTCRESGETRVVEGPWHDLVVRSALVLKLMTYAETGAIVAAPTTSLPEEIGGVRNWDYRFTWLRDAAFVIQALSNVGHTEEAMDYLDWFMELCHSNEPAKI